MNPVAEVAHAPKPTKVVAVLLDRLNRHLLGAHGSNEFATPNLDRFAASSTTFERHHLGSRPGLPARHDLLSAHSTSCGGRGIDRGVGEEAPHQLARLGLT